MIGFMTKKEGESRRYKGEEGGVDQFEKFEVLQAVLMWTNGLWHSEDANLLDRKTNQFWVLPRFCMLKFSSFYFESTAISF